MTAAERGSELSTFFPVQPGDGVRLRKAHPCGGKEWAVTRIGADIGLECRTCGRRVLLPRDEFDRRCVAHIPAPDTAATAAMADNPAPPPQEQKSNKEE